MDAFLLSKNIMNDILSLEKMEFEFINYMYGIVRLSEKTVKAYKFDLKYFVEFMLKNGKANVFEIQKEDIEAFLATIPHSKSGSMANYNRKVFSLRSFFKFLERRGLKDNPTNEFKPTKDHIRQISYLSEVERQELIEAVQRTATRFYKLRDLAIISLFLNVGIRVSELTGLEIKDIDLRDEGVSYIKVNRKGGSQDRLPISQQVAVRIKAYLAKRGSSSESSLFLGRRGTVIRSNTVYHLVRMYLRRAGIKKEKMGPHILRHTVGVSLLRKGVDLVTIQRILGHKKLDTTSIYLHIEPEDIERAVELTGI